MTIRLDVDPAAQKMIVRVRRAIFELVLVIVRYA